MIVEWDPYALDDFFRLTYDDAVAVARAVAGWSEGFAGVVHTIGAGGRECRLFVGERHVVVFLYDEATDTMHVLQVRRA